MDTTTSTTRSGGRTPSGRSRLTRVAAAAIGVLSFAGLVVGTGTPASAATTTTAATAHTAEAPRVPQQRLRLICLSVEGVRGATDRDCGRDVEVSVPGAIQSVGLAARRTPICVAVRGVGGAMDRDCARRGGMVEASVPGVVSTVMFYVGDTRICGSVSSDGDWGPTRCNRSGGWLTLRSPGWRGIDGIQLELGRGGWPRH